MPICDDTRCQRLRYGLIVLNCRAKVELRKSILDFRACTSPEGNCTPDPPLRHQEPQLRPPLTLLTLQLQDRTKRFIHFDCWTSKSISEWIYFCGTILGFTIREFRVLVLQWCLRHLHVFSDCHKSFYVFHSTIDCSTFINRFQNELQFRECDYNSRI